MIQNGGTALGVLVLSQIRKLHFDFGLGTNHIYLALCSFVYKIKTFNKNVSMDVRKIPELGENANSLCDSKVDELEKQNTEENTKELFNGYLKMEAYYKEKVNDFVNSKPVPEIVVVLIDFSAVGEKELKGQLIPGEMALSAFSVHHGVMDNCSFYIKHGNNVPTEALKSIENLLQLPTTWEPEDNYNECIQTLNLFRKKHRYGNGINQHALLFCRKSEYDRVTSCLDFLFKRRGGDFFGYQIFPLEYVLSQMACDIYTKNKYPLVSGHSFDQEAFEILEQTKYKKLKRMACNYHRTTYKGFCYCPLRNVNLHAYNITGILADPEVATVGIHTPSMLSEKEELNKRINQLKYWSTIFERRVPILIPKNYKSEELPIINGSSNVEVAKSTEFEKILVPDVTIPLPVNTSQGINTLLSESSVSPPEPENVYAGQSVNPSIRPQLSEPQDRLCPPAMQNNLANVNNFKQGQNMESKNDTALGKPEVRYSPPGPQQNPANIYAGQNTNPDISTSFGAPQVRFSAPGPQQNPANIYAGQNTNSDIGASFGAPQVRFSASGPGPQHNPANTYAGQNTNPNIGTSLRVPEVRFSPPGPQQSPANIYAGQNTNPDIGTSFRVPEVRFFPPVSQNNPGNVYAGQNMNPVINRPQVRFPPLAPQNATPNVYPQEQNIAIPTLVPALVFCPTLVSIPLLLPQMPSMRNVYYLNSLQSNIRPDAPHSFNHLDQNSNQMRRMDNTAGNGGPPISQRHPNVPFHGIRPRNNPASTFGQQAPNSTLPENIDVSAEHTFGRP